MPLKEYRCRDCGTEFETWDADPACPECTKVDAERVFLTPPGMKSKETNFKDHVTKDLAQSYGLSNMNNSGGQAVKRSSPPPEVAPTFGTGNPEAMKMLAKVRNHSDSFSPVLPMLQRMGRPHQWHKEKERK